MAKLSVSKHIYLLGRLHPSGPCRASAATSTARRPQLFRRLTCSAFALELQRVTASARLNSMHGPLPRHSEDCGQPIDTVLPPGLELMQQKSTLAGREFTLVVPRSIDAVLDMYIAYDQGDRDPYWARPWPAALALAQLILQQPQLVMGKRVCDFGCGLGLAGIAAALSGAKEVVMLDREHIALQCALLSAQASGVASVEDYRQYQRPEAGLCYQQDAARPGPEIQHSAAQNHTGQSGSGGHSSDSQTDSQTDSQSDSPQVRGQLFDWSQPSGAGQYDVALACDVLYEAFSVEPVAQVIPKLLSFKTGRLLLADPSRRTEQNRDRFIQILSNQSPAMMLQERSEVCITMDELETQVEMQILKMRHGQETVGPKHSRNRT